MISSAAKNLAKMGDGESARFDVKNPGACTFLLRLWSCTEAVKVTFRNFVQKYKPAFTFLSLVLAFITVLIIWEI